MKPTIIYALCHPVTSEVRYIGKTVTPVQRYTRHKMATGNTHKDKWIRSIRPMKPEFVELELVDNYWGDAEQFWIAYFKYLGANLVNGTLGGEGSLGCKLTETAKQKISAANTGRSPSAETRKKISEAVSKERHWNYGKTIPEEIKEKIRQAHIGKKMSSETIEKFKNRPKRAEYIVTTEMRRKIRNTLRKSTINDQQIIADYFAMTLSDICLKHQTSLRTIYSVLKENRVSKKGVRKGHCPPNKGKKMSDEQRQKLSDVRTGRKLTDEWKQNISKATKGKSKTPETKEKMKSAWVERKNRKIVDTQ